MARLLRCLFWKSDSCRPEMSAGLPGRSTRTTLAPQSASWRTQTGPARAWVKSRTTRSSRACDAGLWTIVSGTRLLLPALFGDDRLRPLGEILRRGEDLL